MIKLIKDNIDNIDEVIILPQQKNGFLGACKILSETIKKYVEDNNMKIVNIIEIDVTYKGEYDWISDFKILIYHKD